MMEKFTYSHVMFDDCVLTRKENNIFLMKYWTLYNSYYVENEYGSELKTWDTKSKCKVQFNRFWY